MHEIAESVAVPRLYIFNTSLAIRTLPNEWKHATITAILKKGRKNFTTKLQTHKPDFNYMQNNGKHYLWCNNQSYEKQQIIQPQTVRIYNWSINSTTATTCIRYLVRNTRLGGNLDVIYCDFMKAFIRYLTKVWYTKLTSMVFRKCFGMDQFFSKWQNTLSKHKQRNFCISPGNQWHSPGQCPGAPVIPYTYKQSLPSCQLKKFCNSFLLMTPKYSEK